MVTPVRRSARNPVASQALPSSVLRQSGYSYVPNNYLESRLGKEVVIGPPEAFRAFLEVRWGGRLSDTDVCALEHITRSNKVQAEESVTMNMAALHMDEPVDEGDKGLEEDMDAVEGRNKDGETKLTDTLAGRRCNGSESSLTDECRMGVMVNAFAEAPELEGSRAQDASRLPASRSRTTKSTAKQGKLSMSPTEQDIRETLRRSARARRA